jgi:hypothetical protein
LINLFLRIAVEGFTRLKFDYESLLVCSIGDVNFDVLIDVETIVLGL